MSTKRDLVEAHSFNRRRLVTAFVSGAPGGREVEPIRYGRTLVGGLVLAALLVAGAAVAGFIKPQVQPDWLDGKLVIGQDTGSRFVSFKKTLYPVINTTSARLLLATDGHLDVRSVPDDMIAEQRQGATIGIPGAPDILPTPSNLQNSGWSACTNELGGIRVSITRTPGVRADGSGGFLARSAGNVFLVAGTHRYPLPGNARQRSATLRPFGLDGEPVHDVPGRWLDLVTPGSPLAPFAVPHQGTQVDTGAPGLDRVGTPVIVDGVPYVLGPDKKLEKLTEFAFAMYRSSGPGSSYRVARLHRGDVTRLGTLAEPAALPYPQDWPKDVVSPYTSPADPCLLLTARKDKVAVAHLARPVGDKALAIGASVTRQVDAGRGALVRASTGEVVGSGTAFLVDSTGTRYAVGEKGAEEAARVSLGYRDVLPAPVPSAWVQLFGDGPQLSARAASRPAVGQ